MPMPATQPIVRLQARSRQIRAVVLLSLLVIATGVATASAAPSPSAPMTVLPVRIDASRPQTTVAPGFVGLSFETPTLGSPAIGTPASHLPRLLTTLGNGLLRFAGDSADHAQWLPPGAIRAPWAASATTPTQLAGVARLAGPLGWRVLLGLNLGHPLPATAADEARSAVGTLGASLAGVEIGNEPDLYARPVPMPFRAVLGGQALRDHAWSFSRYAAQYETVRAAVASAAPTATLYGPATATLRWLRPYVARVPTGLRVLTQHYYPFDRCHGGRLLAHGPSIASLLSRRAAERERREIASVVAAGAASSLAVRIDEANSVACGGQPNTSDTFASALWAIDFGLLSARSGAVGVDFHGGLGSCQKLGTLASPWYTPLCAATDGRLRAQPEYYGLILLSSLAGDRFLPATYRAASNVSVYALRAPDASLRVVVDDMDTPATVAGGHPRPLTVALQVGNGFKSATTAALTAPAVTAKHAITFGGAAVAADGGFAGPTATALPGADGTFRTVVVPGSAEVVTLRP